MLDVVMLIVVMLIVIMLSVLMLSVVMLIVVVPNFVKSYYFMILLLLFSKIFIKISDSFKLWKFLSHNMKSMAKGEKVHLSVT